MKVIKKKDFVAMKIDKKIELVRATNSEFSSMSIKSTEAIAAVLRRYYTSVVVTTVDCLQDLDAIVMRSPDLVFNGVKFIKLHPELSAKVWIADYLEKHGITVTGSGGSAHILESDKFLAKRSAIDAGLSTSKYIVVKENEELKSENISLSYPVFIKPTSMGGGAGIDEESVAHSFEQLAKKVESIAFKYKSDSLVEEYLPGREFSVAILKNSLTNQHSIMPLELIAPINSEGNRILTYKVKLADTETFAYITDSNIRTAVGDLAIDIFHVLGARDYGRVDIRMDKNGAPQFLEANLIPSLVENFGNFPKACKLNNGLSFESLILQIANLGLVRANENIMNMTEDSALNSFVQVLV